MNDLEVGTSISNTEYLVTMLLVFGGVTVAVLVTYRYIWPVVHHAYVWLANHLYWACRNNIDVVRRGKGSRYNGY